MDSPELVTTTTTPAEVTVATPEQIDAQVATLMQEAAKHFATDSIKASQLLAAATKLMKSKGEALESKQKEIRTEHEKEMYAIVKDAYDTIASYAAEKGLTSFSFVLPWGFNASTPEETAAANAIKFNWGAASIKRVRQTFGKLTIQRKRSGKLLKDGEEVGKYESMTAAAKAHNIAIPEGKQGKPGVPVKKVLEGAGYTWVNDQ